MAWPKISIIWLNYNSFRILPIVLKSLESIINLNYPSSRFELIVVDNGSTDGSFEKIKEFIAREGSIKKKIIRLSKNYGFTGGNNIGFVARDKESKYVLLVNNDTILLEEGLKTLAEYAENYEDIAGVQGILLRHGTGLIDTAGGYLSELLHTYALGQHREYPWIIKRPLYITYVDGSCAFFRVENVLKCFGSKLFIDELFAYYEDVTLSLMLWNCAYKLIAIPKIIASHVRSLTSGRGKKGSFTAYLFERNRVALSLITNSRYRPLVPLTILKDAMISALRTELRSFAWIKERALFDGIRLGKRLKSKGIFIDIYRAPLIKISIKDVKNFFSLQRLIMRYFESWAIKNLDLLTVE
jgi:GT2 family glycosyltransferase